MNVLPVIARELRAESRHAFTYWLRVLGAGALMLVVAFFHNDHRISSTEGLPLFSVLHGVLFWLVWIFVPLLAADCISREKRQGTLGLLFLTPLKPRDIVIAKSLAHGLRSLALCLAVIPVLAVPLLMGGVSGSYVGFSVLLLGSVFCWALAAGLLASAWNRRWLRALVLAAMLAGIFLILFIYVNGFVLTSVLDFFPSAYVDSPWEMGLLGANPILLGSVLTNFPGAKPSLPFAFLMAGVFLLFCSFMVLLLVIAMTAVKIRRTWREEPPSAFRLSMRELFCQPMVLVPLYRRLMRRKMEKNPIGWLEQRTWSGRIVTWSWFAILISVYSSMLAYERFYGGAFVGMQNLLAFGLLISMAATAAGSFQRERESGMLELLLVSPIKTSQILGGRLRGIWGQFLLMLVLWLWVWFYFIKAFGWVHLEREDTTAVGFCVCSFVTVPVIGLYYSLRQRNFITSLCWTLAVGLLLPMYLSGLLQRFQDLGKQMILGAVSWFSLFVYFLFSPLRITVWTVVVQSIIAALLAIGLYENLARRKFAGLQRRE